MEQRTRRQTTLITIPANATGTPEIEFALDTNYAKVIGITVYPKGVHRNYSVGFKRIRGRQLEDITPFEHYAQTESERYAPADIEISNDKIVIQTEIEAAENNELKYFVTFTLEV
jgi:hypothetical protein